MCTDHCETKWQLPEMLHFTIFSIFLTIMKLNELNEFCQNSKICYKQVKEHDAVKVHKDATNEGPEACDKHPSWIFHRIPVAFEY